MSDRPIIEVEGLGKRYRLGAASGHKHERYTALRDVLARAVTTPLRAAKEKWQERRNASLVADESNETGASPFSTSSILLSTSPPEEFWALKDVSFSVQRGEVLGIIGRNGAGKSTLLKILSRITEPTEGRITIRGRVASLLEVGTGFHPELTGRENIFLNGAILGMHRHEIRGKFDEIVTFAEVERFLDTPVKRYSSGMYVRLAFAVAAHLEPEILIIDEVLAVGDLNFQKKCLGKMESVARAGRTVLFVSHNMGTLANLCSQALLLKDGTKDSEGPVQKVVSNYIQLGSTNQGEAQWAPNDPRAGNDSLRLMRARTLCQGKVTSDVEIDQEVTTQFDFEVLQPGLNVSSSIHLYDKQGIWVLCSGTRVERLTPGIYRHEYFFPEKFLNDGLYSVSLILILDVMNIQVWLRDAITFFVHETGHGREEFAGIIGGCVRPTLRTSSQSLTGAADARSE